jgi:hypothetical protein
MRRTIGASALALVALLALTSVAAGTAQATTQSVAPADDTFYPNDQPPADTPTPASDTVPAGAGDTADRELALARGNRQAADLFGYLPSLYQGKWYVAGKESVRRCIMDRESNFSYRAVGAGTYFGAYQMNAGLARGATYTMEREAEKEMGAEGAAIVRALRKTTPNNWNRYWQDRAFWTIWHQGDGAGNWRGGGLNCF